MELANASTLGRSSAKQQFDDLPTLGVDPKAKMEGWESGDWRAWPLLNAPQRSANTHSLTRNKTSNFEVWTSIKTSKLEV